MVSRGGRPRRCAPTRRQAGRRPIWLPPLRGPTPLIKGRCRAATEGIGKLSAVRLTDEGNHAGNGRSFPPPPHPSFASQMPPSPLRGRLGRRGQAPALRVCVARRGRCPHRPAGGHMGPPLRILTNGAGWTKTPHPSRPSAVLSSPEGESSARRVVAPYKRPPPLWGRCPSVRTGAEGGKRPVCRNDSIYGCPPQSRLTARQLPRKGGAKAGRTLCAPTHLGGDQKIINFQFSILNF